VRDDETRVGERFEWTTGSLGVGKWEWEWAWDL